MKFSRVSSLNEGRGCDSLEMISSFHYFFVTPSSNWDPYLAGLYWSVTTWLERGLILSLILCGLSCTGWTARSLLMSWKSRFASTSSDSGKPVRTSASGQPNARSRSGTLHRGLPYVELEYACGKKKQVRSHGYVSRRESNRLALSEASTKT